MSRIHPTALIDPAAELDSSVSVGPYAIIEGSVKVGPETVIGPHAYITGSTTIGERNEIHVGAIIGHVPQHKSWKNGDSGVKIGNDNVIREYASIHRAYHPGQTTVIGDHNFLMGYSHVAHDVAIGNHVVLANGALLAGHSTIMDYANISGNVAVHQYVRIGRFAMIGGLARVSKDVPPFMMIEGNSEVKGLNTVGLRRGGFDAASRQRIKKAFQILFRSGYNVAQAVEWLEANLAGNPEVEELTEFIRGSARGICRHLDSRLEYRDLSDPVEDV